MPFTGLTFAREDAVVGHGEETLDGSVSNVKIEAITPTFFLRFPDDKNQLYRTSVCFSLSMNTICATAGLLYGDAFVMTSCLYERDGYETALTKGEAS